MYGDDPSSAAMETESAARRSPMTLPDTQPVPRWRGVNHLAMVTNDIDATTRFYVGVLGARLVATVGTSSFRHYFFELGQGTTIAFFEYRGVDLVPYAKPAGVPSTRAVQFDHLALALSDEEALIELRDRLKSANCEVTDVVDHGFLRSIYFNDPNGIALEASWWTVDPTGHAVLALDDERVFGDPSPVAAVEELRRDGRLSYIPATKLVDDYTEQVEDWVVRP
jgi:catechol 2,3-dioxygenase-like lactoylglutathione lyase family enzyme